jgi:Tol biopolymer transport system component
VSEITALLEDIRRQVTAEPGAFERVARQRDRKRRNRRVGTIALALLVAAIGAVGLTRAFGHVGHQVPAVRPPTGTIVFSRQLPGSEVDYPFAVGPDGARRVLVPKGIDVFSISPDGSRVLYADIDWTGARADGVLPAVVDLDGSHRRLIRSSVPIDGLWPQAWSPDGARIVGVGSDAEQSSATGLYTARSSDGGDLVQVTSAPGRRRDNAIGYSPDGSKILFLRSANDVAGNNGRATKNLFVVNTDGSGLLQLNPAVTVLGPFDSGVAGTPASPMFDLRTASWSPDGTRVAFAAALATPGEARHGEARRGLFVADADGSGAHQIVPSAQILDAQWSPEGDWIAFTQANADRPDVFIVHPDGTGLRQLTSSSGGLGSYGPVWSPDGSALLFVRNGGGGQFDSELWFMNIDGSGLTQLTHAPAEYFCYGWSPSSPEGS